MTRLIPPIIFVVSAVVLGVASHSCAHAQLAPDLPDAGVLDLAQVRLEFDDSMEQLANTITAAARSLCRMQGKGDACDSARAVIVRTYMARDGSGLAVMRGQDGKERVMSFARAPYGWQIGPVYQ